MTCDRYKGTSSEFIVVESVVQPLARAYVLTYVGLLLAHQCDFRFDLFFSFSFSFSFPVIS